MVLLQYIFICITHTNFISYADFYINISNCTLFKVFKQIVAVYTYSELYIKTGIWNESTY